MDLGFPLQFESGWGVHVYLLCFLFCIPNEKQHIYRDSPVLKVKKKKIWKINEYAMDLHI